MVLFFVRSPLGDLLFVPDFLPGLQRHFLSQKLDLQFFCHANGPSEYGPMISVEVPGCQVVRCDQPLDFKLA